MTASKVGAIDQDAASAARAHLPESDFLTVDHDGIKAQAARSGKHPMVVVRPDPAGGLLVFEQGPCGCK